MKGSIVDAVYRRKGESGKVSVNTSSVCDIGANELSVILPFLVPWVECKLPTRLWEIERKDNIGGKGKKKKKGQQEKQKQRKTLSTHLSLTVPADVKTSKG